MKTIVTTCTVLAILAAPMSLAGVSLMDQAKTRTCKLEATDAGFALGAEGIARLYETSRGESMAVKVLAKVEDKTLLIVSIQTHQGRSFDVGMVEMMLGAGIFKMQGLKLFPVGEVASVAIRLKDTVLLEGSCSAPTTE